MPFYIGYVPLHDTTAAVPLRLAVSLTTCQPVVSSPFNRRVESELCVQRWWLGIVGMEHDHRPDEMGCCLRTNLSCFANGAMLHRWGCSKAKSQQHRLLPLLQLHSDCKLGQLVDVLQYFSWQMKGWLG